MKALFIDAVGASRLGEASSQTAGPGDVVLKVRHVGLCGSDLNTFRGLNPLVELPRIPGHEIGAEIVSVGADVPARFEPGARATVLPYTCCGACASCRKGRTNACRFNRTLGVQQDGALRETLVVPFEKVILNQTLAARQLALVEPLSVGFHAVERGRVASGDRVLVIGCGMIGMGALIGAVRRGAEATVLDIAADKLALARSMGASAVIDPTHEPAASAVERLTGGEGYDVVIEAVGAPETFTQAVDFAGYAGRIVYIGYCKAPVSYQTQLFNLKELDIHGSRNATMADFDAVIACLEEMGGRADQLVTRTFPLDDAALALPFWKANRSDILKIMVEL